MGDNFTLILFCFTLHLQALDAAVGMEFLHSHKPQPIIHRDLKSDNLLVDENDVVKVFMLRFYPWKLLPRQ